MAARLSTFRIDGIQRPMSRICLGTSLIGSGMPRDQSFAMLDAFAARGGTFIDTALVYASTNAGRTVSSEESLGAWMGERGMRETMVVATKGGHPTHGSTRRAHLRPEEIGIDIERSRGRLGLEAIDLYYLHRDDPAVPVDEVLTALEDHRRAGRIRAYAASHWSAARLAAAADAARRRSWPGFSASQIGWSLAEVIPARIPLPNLEFMDAAALAFHRASGMPVIPFSCQAGGFFAKAENSWMYDTPSNLARRARVVAEAQRRGVSANSLALAWILSQPCAGGAVVGPRTLDQLDDTLAADAIRLDGAALAALADG